MQITLNNIGKRYNREWIFRNVNHTFRADAPCVLTGGNGSGKSTLLQVVAGNLLPSEGQLRWDALEATAVYRHLSLAAPYLELMEEFTLAEAIDFQGRFKPWRDGRSRADLLALSGLEAAQHKTIRHYSSGMKQRVRLLLAIVADTPLLLLDEPCANLDPAGIAWYGQLVAAHLGGRTVLVCSNQQRDEHFFCTTQLAIEQFK